MRLRQRAMRSAASEMVEDTWYSLALPLLEYLNDADPLTFPNVGVIADALHVDPWAVVTEIDRLAEAGYIRSGVHKTMTGGDPRPWFVDHPELAERGARAVGMWPADDPYDALMALVDRHIAEEPDEEERSKLRRFADALGEVGKSVGTAILVEWAKGTVRF
jgi:hypothetical protein